MRQFTKIISNYEKHNLWSGVFSISIGKPISFNFKTNLNFAFTNSKTEYMRFILFVTSS